MADKLHSVLKQQRTAYITPDDLLYRYPSGTTWVSLTTLAQSEPTDTHTVRIKYNLYQPGFDLIFLSQAAAEQADARLSRMKRTVLYDLIAHLEALHQRFLVVLSSTIEEK